MTDGSITFDFQGRELKQFNAQDGLGIYFARKAGLIIGIITGRESEVNKIRAEELEIDFLDQGHKNKLKPYAEFKKLFNMSDYEIGFVGDDLLDLPVMLQCGFAAGVQNGRSEIKEHSHFVTRFSGGEGAVREVIEFILKHQNKWQDIVNRYNGKTS
jgi:3-deoxy-D-manno-octulosonate 8-phosphate phosphatase (KDO 8-P phosphatase)